MKQVFWTDHAIDQLSKIFSYIASDSVAYAKITIDKITSRSEQISLMPRSGRKTPEYRDDKIREILEGNYRIIYKILKNQIDVLSVIHMRQNLKE